MKRIETTCGYREEYDNGEIRYYYDNTFNGFCYKDDTAIEKKEGVAYIREATFLDRTFENETKKDYVTADELKAQGDGLNTYEEMKAHALEYFKDEIPEGYPYTDKFIDWVVRVCYDILDWQGFDMLIDELDWDFGNENDPDMLPYPWEWKKSA